MLFVTTTCIWMIIYLGTSVSAQCAGTPLTLTASSSPQYLTSPGWSSSYDNDLDCSWHVQGSNNAIVINVQDVILETGYSFCRDILRVYAGASASGTLLHEFCTGTIPTRVFKSTDTSGDLFITLTTDSSVTDTGFQLMYFISNAANQPACGSTLTASTTETYLMTTTLPDTYTANLDCTYIITGSDGYIITIAYYMIDIQFVTSCSSDIFVVRDGSDASARLLQVHCTSGEFYNLPSTVTTSNSAYINLRTDATTNHYGFFISYSKLSQVDGSQCWSQY